MASLSHGRAWRTMSDMWADLELGFSARSLWGSWRYGEITPGDYVLYLPYITWLGGYTALVHRTDSYEYSKASQSGDWQVVPGFHKEVPHIVRSYYP